MAADLSMNQIIHAAVRRDLTRTAVALRHLPAGDSARARAIRGAFDQLVGQLHHHHESEDRLLWPYLRQTGVDADLCAEMEAEHQAMSSALAEATAALEDLVADPTPARARDAAETVEHAHQVTVAHLDHEERDIEPLVRQRAGDPAWRAVEKQFRPDSITDSGRFLAWVQDGAGQRELTALKQTIPAPVVVLVGRIFGRGYHREIAPVWRS